MNLKCSKLALLMAIVMLFQLFGLVGVNADTGGNSFNFASSVNAKETVKTGEYASSAAQYQRLKQSLATEEIQSVIKTTEHGAERLMSRGFSPSEISALKLSPSKVLSQTDGASVYIKDIGSGKFNVIVEGENGVVTALKNIGQNSLDRLGKNYGWK
jgi:hypothetical protein